MENCTLFDPRWRDDVYDEGVWDIPLVLPEVSEPGKGVWVAKKVIRGEEVFGEFREYKKPRVITAMVKKVRAHEGRKLTDEDGNEVPEDSPVWDLLNPPKAWMSDNAQELMTMYSAAKQARGDVLVGGLGMGIYPQTALHLGRPVDTFTIVDSSPEVIDITGRAWLEPLEAGVRDKIEIIEKPFEKYIEETGKKFDTIFVDLWEDSDPRFLPYINLLVEELKPLCKEGGRIYIWAYALAVDAFVKLINFFEESDIDVKKIPAPIDPLMTAYGNWRALEENAGLSMEAYEKKAYELALTVKLPDFDYNRDSYFFPHADSFPDRHVISHILGLSRRNPPAEEEEEEESLEARAYSVGPVRKVSD